MARWEMVTVSALTEAAATPTRSHRFRRANMAVQTPHEMTGTARRSRAQSLSGEGEAPSLIPVELPEHGKIDCVTWRNEAKNRQEDRI